MGQHDLTDNAVEYRPATELDRLREENRRLTELALAQHEALREVSASGVEFDDVRLDYVVVQVDRETWETVRGLLARWPKTGGG